MKPKSTSPKRTARIASFLLTILFVAAAAFSSFAQQPMERVYANDVQKSDDDYLLLLVRSGYVENEGNAVDENTATAATLNSTGVTVAGINLGGEAVIRLRFTGPDKPAPGTPVTVKMGMGGAVLSLLNNITVQAINGPQTNDNGSGNEVGSSQTISDIVGVLAGENQIEFTVTPQVAYDGLKIRLAPADGILAADLLVTTEVYDAYFLQPASGPVACDQPFDLLYGATGSIAGVVNPVVNPYNSIDGNTATFSVLNANASALDNRTQLTAIFPGTSPAGDSIHIFVQDPGGLLDLALLSEKFYVRTFNGTTDNGILELNQNLLRLNLLAGSSDIYEITYPVNQPFDRIQVAVGGGLAAALEHLNVYEIGRLAAGPVVAGVVDNIFAVCAGAPVTLAIENPVGGQTYTWYDQAGASVGTGTSFEPGTLAAGDHIYYVTTTRPGCTTESGRTMVVVSINETAVAADITLDDLATCEGSAVVLSPASTLTNPVYTWYKDANKTEAITDGLTEGAVSYAIDASGTLTVTGLTAGADLTYYVGVAGDEKCENAAGQLKAVNVTVTAPPAAPVLAPQVSANTGEGVTLTAALPVGAPAGATIVWYDEANAEIGTGLTINVGPFATAGTYTFHAAVRVGDCESAVADVAVVVTGAPVLPDETCNLPTSQDNEIDGLLCILCQVSNPNNSIDDDPNNFTRLTVGVGLAAEVSQQLIFDQASKAANDSIRVRLGIPTGLVDAGLLNSITLTVLNGTAVVSSYDLESPILDLRLLGGQEYEVTVPADGDYDRIEVRIGGDLLDGGLLGAATSIDIYGAQIIYPAPDLSGADLAACVGETPTITVAGGASTTLTWYSAATGGTALGTGNSFTPAAPLTTTTTYYIEVSRDGVNCINPERVPVTVEVTPVPDAPGVVSPVPANTGVPVNLTAALPDGAPAGSTIVWYADETTTTEEGTGENISVGPFNTEGTYAYYAAVRSGDCESARVPVTINVSGPPVLPSETCNLPTAQVSGVEGLLCLLCQVSDPNNSIDDNPANFTRLTVGVGVGSEVYQQLIFDQADKADNDSIRVRLTIPGGLADAGVLLQSVILTVMNGAAEVSSYDLEDALLTIRLLGGEEYEVTIPAGGAYDRVEVRLDGGLLSAVTSVDVYGAQIIYPGPQDVPENGITVCAGETPTLTATAEANTTLSWYDAPTGGNLLGSGNSFTPAAALTATTTYYIEVSRDGVNCANPERVPFTVTVTPSAVAADITLDDLATCEGSAVVLSPASTLTNPVYTWYKDANKTEAITDGLTEGAVSYAIDASGTLTVTGLTAGADLTYYVGVAGDEKCENAAGQLKAVNVTVTAPPAAPVLAPQVSANTGEGVTLTAALPVGAPAGATIVWYDEANAEIGTGLTINVGPFATAGTYTFHAAVRVGDCESAVADVAVVVTGAPVLPDETCNLPTSQDNGVSGLLCLVCQVIDPNNSIDEDPNNFTRLTVGVGVGSEVYQQLIFDQADKAANDSIRVRLTIPGGLLDAGALLQSIELRVLNGTTEVSSYTLEDALLTIRLLSGEQYEVTVAAGGVYDRLEVRLDGGLLSAVTSLDVYGAQIIYPDPDLSAANLTVCSGETPTITVAAAANTTLTWYAAATGGAALGTGNSFTPAAPLTTTTTYYIEVSRDGVNCVNPERVPVTVTVSPGATAADIVAGNTTICEAGTAVLTASLAPGVTLTNPIYRWYSDAALTDMVHEEAASESSFTTPALTQNTTYYVTVEGAELCENLAADAKVVTVTVGEAPAAPQVQAGVTISSGQSATLTASLGDPAPAGVELVWYSAATGGTELGTGATYSTGPLTATTTYYVAARNTATGCESLTRASVTVTVDGVTPGECLVANAQTTGSRAICVLCSVENAGNAVDGDLTTASRLVAPVSVTGGVWQDLIFPEAGQAGDTVIVHIGLDNSLLDAALLGNLVIRSFNGTTENNDGSAIDDNLLTLRLIPGNSAAEVWFIAGGAFDRVRVEQTGLLNVLGSSYMIYGAEVRLPAPTALPPANQTICQGGTLTLEATPSAGTTLAWYDVPVGGTALATGNSYDFVTDGTTAPGVHTFYIGVFRDGCENPVRIPVEVTVTEAYDADDIVAADVTICQGTTVATLTAAAAPGVTITDPVFTWYSDATLTTEIGTGATLTLDPAPTAATTTYYVTIAESNGDCENIAGSAKAVVLTVTDAPAAPTLVAADLTTCAGSAATFEIDNPQGGVTYNWYDAATGGTLVHSGTTLTVDAATAGMSWYIETVVDGGGCVSLSRTAATLTVTPSATAADITAADATICEGETAMLSASSTTVTAPIFRWYSNADLSGTPHEGATYDLSGLTAGTYTYYVTVEGTGVCENLAADAKVVTVTVGEAPAAPQVQAGVTISSGQSATLTASLGDPAPAGVELVWYSAATGGTELGTGATYSTGPLTATTTYYVAARNTATGCESLTRASVTVTVDGVTPGECLVANAQTTGSRAICVLCSVENAGNAVDGDLTTASRLVAPVSVTGGVWQDLIFPEAGQAGDTVIVHIGLDNSLLDAALLGNLVIRSFNGTTENNDGSAIDDNLLTLRLIPGNSAAEVWFIAGGAFDRVRVEQTGLLNVLGSSYMIYGAEVRLPAPTALPPANQTICQGGTLTLEATPSAGTTLAWYDVPVGGTALATGNSYDFVTDGTTAPGVHTFYIGVFRDGCENPVRIPVEVTVTEAYDADDIVAADVTICQGTTVATLTAAAAPGVTITDPVFTWYSDATLTTEIGTGATLTLDPAPTAATTTYYVTIAESNGDCENIAGSAKAVVLTVTDAPAAPTLVAADLTTCAGSAATFEIDNPQGGVTYNWYDAATGGTLVHSGTTLTVDAATAGMSWYIETVVDGGGCVSLSRTAATLTVTPSATAADITAADATICEGETAMLSASSTTVTAPIFRWYSNADLSGTPHEGATYDLSGLTAGTYTYYVTVEGTGVCENLAADAKVVTVTVGEAPAAPQVQAGVTISSGQSATLTASLGDPAPAGVELVWYSAATGGTELGTGATYSTGPLTATTTYYVAARNTATGCESLTRASVTVTVDGINPPQDCITANAQTVGADGLCLICSVSNPGASVDADPDTYAQLNASVGVAAAVWQELIFPEAGQAGDKITLELGLNSALADLALLNNLTIESFNGSTANGDGGSVNSDVIDLVLLPGASNRFTVSFIAEGAFDRVRIRFAALVAALENVRVYNAQIHFAAPTALPPADLTVCRGETVTLEATPAAGTTIRWYDAETGGNLLSSENSFTTAPLMTVGQITYYIAVVRNGCEDTARIPVTVTVTASPTAADIIVTGNENPVCANEPVILSPSSTTITDPVFKWYKDAAKTQPITSGTEAGVTYAIDAAGVLTVTGLTANVTYWVSVTANGGSGCENPAGDLKSVPVSIQPNAPDGSITGVTVAGDPGNGEICLPANGEVVLTATSTLAGAVFHWYDQDGNPVAGGENGTLTLTGVTAGAYTYYVGVSNQDFCETTESDRASVSFTIKPTVPGADLAAIELTGALPGGNVCLDANGEVTLTAALTASSTVTNPVFHWYDENGNPVAGGENGVQKLALAPGTYTFSVGASGDGFCETIAADRKSITFTVNPTAGPNDIADLTLNGNVPAGGICLAPGEEVILTAALSAASTITNEVFYWYDQNGDPVAGGADGVLNLGELAPGTYTYQAGVSGDGVCESLSADRKTITFTISRASTAADITASGATICEGESATLTASSTGITNPVFNWYSSADLSTLVFTGSEFGTPVLAATTTYYVTVQGDGVCEGEAKEVIVNVGRGGTAADITASDALSCGEPVTLTASSTIAGAVFNWYADAALTQLIATGAEIEQNPTATTTYYVTVQGTGVCENAPGAAKEVTVTVGQEPAAPTIVSTDLTVCPGTGITLIAESQAGTQIVWYAAATGGDPLFTGPEFVIDAVTAPTTYYAEAQTTGGSCVSATRTAVEVNTIPVLAAPVVSCQDRTPSTVTFVWSEVAGATGYEVNVNDAGWEAPSSGSGPQATTHLIENANPSIPYTIKVRAISSVAPCGNSESEASACEVENFNDLFIPNAFTPNGDGKNDFFEVLGTYQELDLKIYNQWGNKVFETRTKGQKWDGSYKGEIMPTGVYVYYVTVTMADGREVFKKGSISLIR